jgi:hypothetical protein
MRSSIGLEIRQRTRKVNLSPEPQQMRIGAGSSHKFKTGADGLCDSGTAGFLCLSEKVRPYLNCDFSGHFHSELSHTIVYTSIGYGVEVHELSDSTGEKSGRTHKMRDGQNNPDVPTRDFGDCFV